MIKKSLLSALALAAALVATGMFAGVGAGSDSAGNGIAGTWSVTVNRPAPLPPLTSLQVFTSDGSWIEMANEDPKTRTSQFGSWERIDGGSTRPAARSSATTRRMHTWRRTGSTAPCGCRRTGSR